MSKPGWIDEASDITPEKFDAVLDLKKSHSGTVEDERLALVPREPTDAMIAAGLESLQESLGHTAVIDRDPLFTYRAMIAAAPSRPVEAWELVTHALNTALVAMTIAAALPKVSREYDFGPAIAEVTRALKKGDA